MKLPAISGTNAAGHIIALCTVSVWGLTFAATKVLLQAFTPIEILFSRFLIGFIALFAIYPKISPIRSIKEETLFLFAGFFGVTLYFLLENTALQYTFASNAGLLVAVSPFISVLLAYLFLKDEKLKPSFFTGMALAVAGCALVILNGASLPQINSLGDILALLAAASWALYSLFVKRINNLKYNALSATRKIFFYGILMMVPLLPFLDFKPDIYALKNHKYLFNMLFLGLGASALCFVSWSKAVKILGTVKTSMYIYLVPAVTVVSSVIILQEPITMTAGFGIALITSGLILSGRK